MEMSQPDRFKTPIFSRHTRTSYQITFHQSPFPLSPAPARFDEFFSPAQKPYLARYSALQCTSYAVWTGTLVLLSFAPDLVRELPKASPSATMAAGYLGIFPAALGYVTWAYTLARIPAARAASFLYLVPPVTLGIAWVWLGQWPG